MMAVGGGIISLLLKGLQPERGPRLRGRTQAGKPESPGISRNDMPWWRAGEGQSSFAGVQTPPPVRQRVCSSRVAAAPGAEIMIA